MIVSGYTTDLYCDAKSACLGEYPQGFGSRTFLGRTLAETLREARRYGWRVSRDRERVTCPKCARPRAKPSTERQDHR